MSYNVVIRLSISPPYRIVLGFNKFGKEFLTLVLFLIGFRIANIDTA